MLEGRARFVEHRGKRIYLFDAGGLATEELLQLVPKVARDVRAEPPGSVLTLSHFKGVRVRDSTNAALRDLARGNGPYVKAAAISGLSPLQRVVLSAVSVLTGRTFKTFETQEEAMDYLAGLP